MKNRFKVSFLSTLALVIASLVCTGSVLAKNDRVKVIRHSGEEICYEFTAESQGDSCARPKSSIWLVKIVGAKCNVKVWAADGDNPADCNTIKKAGNKIPQKDLSALGVKYDGKKLSNALTADTDCDDVWLRFTDDQGCNSRCYINNGRAYCR